MSEPIMVSILCNTYNQENYIRRTLDSFMMQKTNFRFEVLVHDDASIDSTADIIREFEQRYPDVIRPVYQTENQYSQGIKITKQILVPKARGKYLALCEGDDQWIDPLKLQKQFDYMESHPNCSLCAHRAAWYDHENQTVHIFPYQTKARDYTIEDLIICGGSLMATASYFVRKDVYLSKPACFFVKLIGDYQLTVHAASCGEVHCLQDIMSIYNFKAVGSTSIKRFTDKQAKEYSQKYRTEFNADVYKAADRMDKYFRGRYHDEFLYHLRYYGYHINKHRGETEKNCGTEYDAFRLIDKMRKTTKARQDRLANNPIDVSKISVPEFPHLAQCMEDASPKVSVFCVVSDCKDYVSEMLDSFLMQKTDFRFEILICDNGSTDGTTEIIHKYENKYPEVVRPVYLTEFQDKSHVKIIRENLWKLAKGDYFAWCGSYNLWIDAEKLQKQVNYLETNKNCKACLHRVMYCNHKTCKCALIPGNRWMYEKNHSAEKLIPYIRKNELQSAVAALMIPRKIYEELPEQYVADRLGLFQLILHAAHRGEICYLSDVMAEISTNVQWVLDGMHEEEAEKEDSILEEELKTRMRNYEECLADCKKMIASYAGRYEEELTEQMRFWQYHISVSNGKSDLVEAAEYEEYRLVEELKERIKNGGIWR